MYGLTHSDAFGLPNGEHQQTQKDTGNTIKLDGPNNGGLETDANAVSIDGVEQVPTGNSTVPTFPKIMRLPRRSDPKEDTKLDTRQVGDEVRNDNGDMEEYRLLGLGIRTVSFLSIQVYVVGLYVAASDIATLQQRLVRQAAAPTTTAAANESVIAATSLVPGEREALRDLLLDPERGEDVWDRLLKDGQIRSAIRIVPTRNTDFLHLRDGWVRQITGRAQRALARAKELTVTRPEHAGKTPETEFTDDSFGASVNEFKTLFGGGIRKNVPKGQTLLLLRDRIGALDVLFQAGERKPLIWLGGVADERVSRLLWMGYLSGKNVASENARKSIIDGLIEIVERPVGTV